MSQAAETARVRAQSAPKRERPSRVASPKARRGAKTGRRFVWSGGRLSRLEWVFSLGLLGLALYWVFGADLVELADVWASQPDYSHGYLVIPVALFMLLARRDLFPGFSATPGWLGGAALLGLALSVQHVGQRLFLNPLFGWALVLWVAGVCWMLGGRRFFGWVAPSVAFLFFMVPLPYRTEQWLSYPLQRAATKISCWTLQLLGQPAAAEGNTIFMGAQQLEVEQACSGLRMLVSVTALAFAYGVLARKPLRDKVVLMLGVIPVAVLANSVRIVATGLAYRYISADAARSFSHDLAGWAVIPLAAAMMWAGMLYWNRLVVPVEHVSSSELLRTQGEGG